MSGSRIEFRILGPLDVRIDGAPVAIGGPKQRALLALLLLGANRVVSRERLVGELFAEQSVNSADHALRNHVSRLRKVLAPAAVPEPRLVARVPGYLLRVEPGELDFEHFERLVAAGREAARAGDPAAAADAYRAAERLWQGRPLADLEFEAFAQVEVERLEELLLAAKEERIDAELALGRQLALVPELDTLATEHPYRERFRWQLMLALYRAGRQAEGLKIYRRTRTLLNEELGLEPGAELQELERAILVQDPALDLSHGDGRSPPWPVRDVCPFKGLAAFELADAEFFFGRERLVDELVARLADAPLLAIVGASGSGKSSLLRAGLLPALGEEHVLVRPGRTPAENLVERLASLMPGQRTVVAVDQFEELFAASVSDAERRAVVDALVEAAWDPERRAVILIALRADFFGRLAAYPALADLVAPNHVLLGPMSAGELRRAIEGPAHRIGLEVEPELVDALIEDVAGEPGGLPLLSTALLDLWRERNGQSLELAAYERTGGVRGAVARHSEAAYRSFDESEQRVARRILLRLVAGVEGEVLTRRRVTIQELDAEDDEQVASVLAALVDHRLVVADTRAVELVHEALLEHWPRLARWVEEGVQGRRLHRRLTEAVAAWDASGRNSSELFRGARLAATLEWADAAGDDAALNRLERAFLEASQTAFDRENRRLRALLAVAVLLLVAAVVASVVAMAARSSARQQATAAVAQRLGAQALVEPRIDRALLLAREGVELDDSLATRGNLLAALLRSPAALGTARGTGERVLDDALSPDGRLLAVRGNDGGIAFFDARTLHEIAPRVETSDQISYFGAIVRPVRALAFSREGRTLAVGNSDGNDATISLVDARTHEVLAIATSADQAVTADVVFAPDGRTIVTGEAVSGAKSPPSLVLVVRRASDGAELRRSKRIQGGRLIGFAADGRLLVTSGETTSYLLDPRTFARIQTFDVSGAAAISPRRDTAAFGQDDGRVQVLTLRTGKVRSLGRATSAVLALAYSPDGTVLATAADDGAVDVWDLPGGGRRETLTGHAGAALDLLFARNGETAYSASRDGSVIAWDVQGQRRLGRPFRTAPDALPGAGPRTTDDASTAVAVSPDGSLFVTQPGPDRVTLWRARGPSVVAELRGPCGSVDSLAFSHDGRYMAATGDARNTVVWNVETRRIVKLLGPAGEGGATGVNFSPDDTLLATAGVDGHLRVYEWREGRQVGNVPVTGSLQDVDFSSDGRLLVGAGLGPEIALWDVALRKLARTIHHGGGIVSIRFSPDGREIATGDLTGNVHFWDPASGRKVRTSLGGQNGAVLSVTYSPDGTQVFTTSTDGKLRLSELATGRLVGAPLPGAATGGWGTFFPDGKRVIAVFWSGVGVVWDVSPDAWRSQACRIADRSLDRAEWRDFVPERPYRRTCG